MGAREEGEVAIEQDGSIRKADGEVRQCRGEGYGRNLCRSSSRRSEEECIFAYWVRPIIVLYFDRAQ